MAPPSNPPELIGKIGRLVRCPEVFPMSGLLNSENSAMLKSTTQLGIIPVGVGVYSVVSMKSELTIW